MNKRKEKIDLLKGILKGSKKLSELFHPPVILFIDPSGGTYRFKKTGEKLTDDEVHRYHDYVKRTGITKINVTIVSGNDKLKLKKYKNQKS